MELKQLEEPELEFNLGRHIDIRFGLANYGPPTVESNAVASEIRVGFVGTGKSISGITSWMETLSQGVKGKESRYRNYHPDFPGFQPEVSFRANWTTEERLQRSIPNSAIEDILQQGTVEDAIRKAVATFIAEIRSLCNTSTVQVIVCAPPIELFRLFDQEKSDQPKESSISANDEDEREFLRLDFHDMLKAESLKVKTPIQFVRPSTYDPSIKETTKLGRKREMQDMATRAWNFFTALYYKAGGTPWRLCRDAADFDCCYIGVSFYRSLDKKSVRTSVAQVFNERGDGMILRGAEADFCEDDRQHHLSSENMRALVLDALEHYDGEHHNSPARVVLHKTSGFNADELEGCKAALKEYRIRDYDLLVIRDSDLRLFRKGQLPPLRGTHLEIDERYFMLYTRGTVPFFQMYPGQYVPRSLEVEMVETHSSSSKLASEILALTKMNWNNTQFDSLYPITVRAARQVGDLLKYLPDKADITQRYAAYM